MKIKKGKIHLEMGDQPGGPTSEFIFQISLHRFFNVCTKNQGQMFKDSRVPIYGLGVQSHFHSLPRSIDVLKVSVIFFISSK
jgi:hypothetical protein